MNSATTQNIEKLVKILELNPHPEGGYYKEIFRSKNKVGVAAEKFGEALRCSSTSIYFLMTSSNFSAWHRIKSDEIWNHHMGCSITILSIDPNGNLSKQRLGNKLSDASAEYQVVVFAGDWFCAYVDAQDGYALAGCSVAPGFSFNDFELADRDKLSLEFKQHHDLIYKYTRV